MDSYSKTFQIWGLLFHFVFTVHVSICIFLRMIPL